jgi:hypothetical protein
VPGRGASEARAGEPAGVEYECWGVIVVRLLSGGGLNTFFPTWLGLSGISLKSAQKYTPWSYQIPTLKLVKSNVSCVGQTASPKARFGKRGEVKAVNRQENIRPARPDERGKNLIPREGVEILTK